MRSMTRLATLDGCPIQIGRPSRKMSAARIFRRSVGHSSPSPSSDRTPGLMFLSAARTGFSGVSTPWRSNAARRSPSSRSVEDFSLAVEGFSEQLSAKAVRLLSCGMPFSVKEACLGNASGRDRLPAWSRRQASFRLEPAGAIA